MVWQRGKTRIIRDMVQGGLLGPEPRYGGFDSHVSDPSGRSLAWQKRQSGGLKIGGSNPLALTIGGEVSWRTHLLDKQATMGSIPIPPTAASVVTNVSPQVIVPSVCPGTLGCSGG